MGMLDQTMSKLSNNLFFMSSPLAQTPFIQYFSASYNGDIISFVGFVRKMFKRSLCLDLFEGFYPCSSC